jgi:hypothetical protein
LVQIMAPVRSTAVAYATVITRLFNLWQLLERVIEGSQRGRGCTCTSGEGQTSCYLQID